jgi:hypothetical protein
MIELFLSSDGKHTVHVSAETPEDLAELAPKAKALYEKIVESYGNKAQMWQLAIDSQPARIHGSGEIPARGEPSGAAAPTCPLHGNPLRLRRGKYGSFWSCPTRMPDGKWCPVTREIDSRPGENEAPTE